MGARLRPDSGSEPRHKGEQTDTLPTKPQRRCYATDYQFYIGNKIHFSMRAFETPLNDVKLEKLLEKSESSRKKVKSGQAKILRKKTNKFTIIASNFVREQKKMNPK